MKKNKNVVGTIGIQIDDYILLSFKVMGLCLSSRKTRLSEPSPTETTVGSAAAPCDDSNPSSIDEKALDAFITRLLENKNVNCTIFPDAIERGMYRGLLRILLGNRTDLIRTFRMEIMNHVITLRIQPASTL